MMAAASVTPFSLPKQAFKRRGMMVVLSSPPGGGKTTITRELIKRDSKTVLSISATTREMRVGEVNGTHYHFVSRDAFDEMVEKGEMLEYAFVYNSNMYGTPKAPVEKHLSSGKDVLFDIDWQGNRRLNDIAKDDVVSIFILPPSWDELAKRLHGRAQDSEEEIIHRLGKAQNEIAHYTEFQYVIVNNDLEESIRQVQVILEAERNKRRRLVDIQDFVETLKPE